MVSIAVITSTYSEAANLCPLQTLVNKAANAYYQPGQEIWKEKRLDGDFCTFVLRNQVPHS
jgi:hypothetical protein